MTRPLTLDQLAAINHAVNTMRAYERDMRQPPVIRNARYRFATEAIEAAEQLGVGDLIPDELEIMHAVAREGR